MNNILEEAFKYLNEDEEQETSTPKAYPKKCKTFGYKVKIGRQLLCGSIVAKAKRTPELGFNITTPNYGPGSMVDTKRALVFLTPEDAQAFCRKYGISSNPSPYIGQTMEVYVRIDDNNDIPTYMQKYAIEYYPDRLTPNQTRNLNSPIESVEGIVSDNILRMNNTKLKKEEIQRQVQDVAQKLSEVLNETYSFDVQTSVGNIHCQYELQSLHPGRSSETVYYLRLRQEFDKQVLIDKFDTATSKIIIPNHGYYDIDIRLFQGIQEKSEILHTNIFLNSVVDLAENLICEENKGLNFKVRDPGYAKTSNILFTFRDVLRSITLKELQRDFYENINLKTWIRKYKDIDAMKNALNDIIIDVTPKIKSDLINAALIIDKVQDLVNDATENIDDQLVTVSYENINDFN